MNKEEYIIRINGIEAKVNKEVYELVVPLGKIIEHLQQENQSLKEQLSNSHQIKKQNEEYKRLGFKHLNDKCNILENQQKEFISYLENEIKNMNPKNLSIGEFNLENDDEKMLRYLTLKDNLSKFKEIIGDDK